MIVDCHKTMLWAAQAADRLGAQCLLEKMIQTSRQVPFRPSEVLHKGWQKVLSGQLCRLTSVCRCGFCSHASLLSCAIYEVQADCLFHSKATSSSSGTLQAYRPEQASPAGINVQGLWREASEAHTCVQVHRAQAKKQFAGLGPEGLVAVKIQYPGALPTMKRDLVQIRRAAVFLQKTELKFDLASPVDELAAQVRLEFDFVREARLMTRIRDHLRVSSVMCKRIIGAWMNSIYSTYMLGKRDLAHALQTT